MDMRDISNGYGYDDYSVMVYKSYSWNGMDDLYDRKYHLFMLPERARYNISIKEVINMKKRIISLVLIGATLIIFSGCGDEKASSTSRSKHESTLTEETLVEEIHVEEIHVEEIQVNEITWDSDNVSRWD